MQALVLALKADAPTGVVHVLLQVGHQAPDPTMAVACLEQLCVLLQDNSAIAAEGTEGVAAGIVRQLAHHWQEVPASAVSGGCHDGCMGILHSSFCTLLWCHGCMHGRMTSAFLALFIVLLYD
jgi:hypothetical protein